MARAALPLLVAAGLLWQPQGCSSDETTSQTTSTGGSGGAGADEPCADGTLPGQCSHPQPQYCDHGALIANCAECGCADEGTCEFDGHCAYAPTCDEECQSSGFAAGVCRSSPREPAGPTLPEPITAATGPADTWHTHPDLVAMFQALCDAAPGYATSSVIGTTSEGNDITLFQLGNPAGGAVMWDGCLHGWEDIGAEVMYLIARWLLGGEEAVADQILARNRVLFVPVVNMDSYERQNRNFEQCSYGIDLNRNFVTGWQQTPCGEYPDCYNGQSAGSEVETQALRGAFESLAPAFYLNTHYGGGPWLGYFGGNDMDVVNAVTARITALSTERGVTPYTLSTVGTNGMAVGDAHEAGASAWLIEVAGGDGSYMHTAFPYEEIVTTYFPKMLPIFLAMCEACEIDSGAPRCQPRESTLGQSSCDAEQDCCCL